MYAMSTFNIPKKICDKMDAITRRFWWKQKEKEGKFLAWKSWDKLCVPKAAGGLGFRKFKDKQCFVGKVGLDGCLQVRQPLHANSPSQIQGRSQLPKIRSPKISISHMETN